MAINHSFTNPVADGTITSIVRPSDWNSAHVQAYTLAGNTAGNSVVSGTNVILQGGNNVTLSGTGQTIIVSAGSAAGGGGAVISAGTNSTSTGTVVFSNSNGVSFGMGTNGVVTASYTVPTVPTQSTQPVAVSGSNGSFAYSTLSMGASNGLTFYTTNNSIVASYTVPTVPGATVFSNSNNVSFGLAGSTVTASASYPTQTAYVFSNANGVSFGTAGSTVTASVAAAGGAQTGISGIIAGTQTQTAGTLSFANGNGISFGLSNSSVITASYTVPTQTVDTNKAGTGFTSTSTAGVVPAATLNTNGLSFAMPNYLTTAQPVGAYLTTAAQVSHSHAFATTTTNGSVINVATSNSNGITIAVPPYLTTAQSAGAYLTTAAQVSHSHGNPTLNLTNLSGTTASNSAGFTLSLSAAAGGGGADGYNIIGVNGGATQLSTTYQFSNANNITWGLNAGTITASASYAAQTVDTNKAGTGFTSTSTAGIVPAATLNTNGLSFAMPAYITTYVNDLTSGRAGVGFTSTSTAGVVPTATLSTNGLSFAMPNYITTYVNDLTSGRAGVGFTSASTAGSDIVATLSTNGLSVGIPKYLTTTAAQTVQPVAVSGSNGSFAFSTLTMGNLNGLSFYTSNGSVVGSYTVPAGGGVTVLSNSNNVSFGLVGSTYTASASYPAQTNQTGNLYVTANSTQLSSTAGVDLRSLSFAGAGVASVGVSGGVVVISVPSGGGAGDGVNIVQAGTLGTTGTTYSASTGTMFINGGNNITVSQNGSNQLVISAAQGGIAAGTQTATSGTLVFANSNNFTFGMSGSNQITGSFSQSNQTVASGGIAGTGTTFAGANLSASMTMNSNGLNLSMSAGAGGGGGGATIGGYEIFPLGPNTAFTTMGQNTIYFQKFIAQDDISFNNIERRISLSTVSSAVSAQAAHTYDYGLYLVGAGASTSLYNLIASSRIFMQASYSSNLSAGWTVSQGAGSITNSSAGTVNMSALSGFKHLYMPFTSTISAGRQYAIAMRMSSATTGVTGPLRIGVKDMSYYTNLSIGRVDVVAGISISNVSRVGDFAQGVYSVTSSNLPATLGISGLTNALSQMRMYIQLEV
jgi:hypothetical protein